MNGLTGTSRLVRLALRRDRLTLPAWLLGLGAFVAATTAMFGQSLAAPEDLLSETRLVATNTGMRMLGLTSGPSVGGYMLHREFAMLSVLAALMGTLAVVRHTRQGEELGRAEMVGSTVVGRHASLAAAVAVALGAEVALAVVLAAAMVVGGLPAPASLLAGASVVAVGVVFVGVAAVTCQLASTTRGATGAAAAVLGVAFLLSGVGNVLGTVDDQGLRVSSAWPAWLSPVGWGQQTRPFNDGRWWPLLLASVLCAALVVLAAALVAKRDVGRGLLPERRGHEVAARSLLSPAGLTWRLQRGAFIGWAVALFAFGLILGSLVEQLQDVQGGAAEWYAEAGGTGQVVDGYRTSIIQMAGMFVAMYVVQVLLRMRVDEAGGTLEALLSTGVTRSRWVLGHLVDAAAGAAALLLGFGVCMGLAAGQVLGDPGTQVREMAGAGLVQLPGVLVLAGVVVVVVAALPRWAVPVSWALLVAALVLGPMFGPTLDLPQWAQDLSPFTHVPLVPAAELTAAPLVLLTGACVALAGVGLGVLRRRDLLLPA